MADQLQSYLDYINEDKQRKEDEKNLLAYENFLNEESLPTPTNDYTEVVESKEPSFSSPSISRGGKKTLTQLENDPKFAEIANRFLESIGEDDDIFEYLRDSDYSLSAAALRSIQSNSWTDQQAEDYIYLRDQFANAELSGFKERFNFVKDFSVDVLTDPLNIVAAIFAGPTLGGSVAARGALALAAKEGVKRTARQTAKRKALKKAKVKKSAIAGAKIGALEGAAWTGPHEYFLQDIDVDLGAREEIDAGVVLGMTALGGAFGGALGGGIAGVSGLRNSRYLNEKKYKYTNENTIHDAGQQPRQEVLEESRFDQARIAAGKLLNRATDPLKEYMKTLKADPLYKFLGNTIGKATTPFLNQLKDSDALSTLLGKFRYDYDSTLTSQGRQGVKEESYGGLLTSLHGKYVGGLQQATKKLDRRGERRWFGLYTGNKIDKNVNDQLDTLLRDEKLTVNNIQNLQNKTYKGQFIVTDEVLETYVDIKKLLNEGYREGKESGLFLKTTGYQAGYLPRLFNYSALLKNRNIFEEKLIKGGHATPNNKSTTTKIFDDTGKETGSKTTTVDGESFGKDFLADANGDMVQAQKDKAKQIVDDMLEYRNTPFELKSSGQSNSRTSFIESRRFSNLKDEDIKEFLEHDVEVILEDYFTNLSQGIARTKTFGKSLADFDKIYIKPVVTELIASGVKRARLSAGIKEGTETPSEILEKATQDANKVADGLRKMHKRVTGIETPRIKNTGLSKANDFLKLTQQMAHLPFVTLSSITEPFILYSRAGIKDVPQVTKDIFTSIGKEVGNNVDKVVRSIQRSRGKSTKNTDSFTGLKELDDADWKELYQTGLGLEQALQERLAGLVGEAMEDSNMKQISNAFFKATFLTQWTKSVQLASFITGKRLIRQRAQALYEHKQSGGKLIKLTGDKKTSTTKYYTQQLNDLGVDENDAMKWYQNSLDKNGNFSQSLAEAQDFYHEKLTKGANRFATEIILNPSTAQANRPLWFSNPSAQLLIQFAGYPTVFSNTILKRYFNESINSPAQALPKVVMTSIVMGTIAHLGNTLRSQGENLYDYETGEKKPVDELVVEAVRRYGGLGPYEYAYKYAQDSERNVGAVAGTLKTFAGPLPQDVMDAILYRRGFAEVGLQNIPFYQALPSESRKRLRQIGREFDKGKKIDDDKKPKKKLYRYAKGGLVYDVPKVGIEPDERQDRMTGVPYDEQAGSVMKDEEERGISKQMEELLK